MCTALAGFYVGAGDTNSGSHARVASNLLSQLPTVPPAQANLGMISSQEFME